MATYELSARADGKGFRFSLERRGALGLGHAPVAYRAWSEDDHPGVGLLRLLVENEAAEVTGGCVVVPHPTIACMGRGETSVLRLPAACPYSLRLEGSGAVSDPGFGIIVRWLDGSGVDVAGLRRAGTLLASVVGRFLVREPLYSLLEDVDALNATATGGGTLDARMIQLARVKAALEYATGCGQADEYIRGITIHHATGLALTPATAGTDLFAPVLYGDLPAPYASPDNEEATVERGPLLPAGHAARFRSLIFPREGARSHYRLADGVYSVVDPAVQAALAVVAEVNASDASVREAFRADPRSFLIEAIEGAGGSGDILCAMPEAQGAGYGDRVLGIREWEKVRLSFKIPVERDWFSGEGDDTETFTIRVPGSDQPILVSPTGVSRLRDAIDDARAAGRADVEHEGRTYPLTRDLEDTVGKLLGHLAPDHRSPAERKTTGDGRPAMLVLDVAANEEDLVYNAGMRDPAGALSRSEADAPLRTAPMPHQVDGIAWLRHAFLSGMPGVLLADDMGLGKTFQVLAFLNWLLANDGGARAPILVVAPKKLLDVWREEIRTHLGDDGLGRPVLAYDEHLRGLKVAVGREGALGRHALDVARLAAADWVLTTYETLRDYHMSFGRVRFRIGIYDEAQKMKTMASLINNAAKGQQPDFTILMTGTPIENGVMDLWTLLDVAWPGFLGMSGREFAKAYGDDAAPERYAELKDRLVEPVRIGGRDCPPVMMRRFKSGVLSGLPKKTERQWHEDMPPGQVSAYDAVLSDKRSGRSPALQALQALRSVAFHPDLRLPEGTGDHARVIAASARFKALFTILDGAHRAGERVLVFVDLRQGQRILAELVRHRYGMPRHPQVINGDTSTKALDHIKGDFQAGKGFDVLLLGPRSAGFGLTLTAANHVVHMNRWWNPAVEDQCSDRVYRLGQDKDVTIHVPIAVHPVLGDASFDVVLDAMLSEKRGLSREIVVPTTMTEGDFRRMMAVVTGEDSSAPGRTPLDTMGWREFEDWTAEQFTRAGYQASRTPRTGDAGADVILRPPVGSAARAVICQCKHRALGAGAMDEDAVNEVLKAAEAYAGRYTWLIDPVLVALTNGRTTLTASRMAAEKGVILVDGTRIDGLCGIAMEILRGPPRP